jgi:tRNA acetyltransferase TAN1
MSVVDGDWEALKRYNINELYVEAISEAKANGAKEKEQETTEGGEEEQKTADE